MTTSTATALAAPTSRRWAGRLPLVLLATELVIQGRKVLAPAAVAR